MINLYCRGKHGNKGNLCGDCQELLDYACMRLSSCPLGEKRTVCRGCAIHCYKQEMRSRIRDVMRYAGPRLLWRNPFLALAHVADGFKK